LCSSPSATLRFFFSASGMRAQSSSCNLPDSLVTVDGRNHSKRLANSQLGFMPVSSHSFKMKKCLMPGILQMAGRSGIRSVAISAGVRRANLSAANSEEYRHPLWHKIRIVGYEHRKPKALATRTNGSPSHAIWLFDHAQIHRLQIQL
jgi:hypothetical protein